LQGLTFFSHVGKLQLPGKKYEGAVRHRRLNTDVKKENNIMNYE
jgi:hypothetical protein